MRRFILLLLAAGALTNCNNDSNHSTEQVNNDTSLCKPHTYFIPGEEMGFDTIALDAQDPFLRYEIDAPTALAMIEAYNQTHGRPNPNPLSYPMVVSWDKSFKKALEDYTNSNRGTFDCKYAIHNAVSERLYRERFGDQLDNEQLEVAGWSTRLIVLNSRQQVKRYLDVFRICPPPYLGCRSARGGKNQKSKLLTLNFLQTKEIPSWCP